MMESTRSALYVADDTSVDGVISRVNAVSEGRQRLRVNANSRIRDLSLEIFDRTFIITDVLYWLALGVALVGILGAMLALATGKRTRVRDLASNRHDARTSWWSRDDADGHHGTVEAASRQFHSAS